MGSISHTDMRRQRAAECSLLLCLVILVAVCNSFSVDQEPFEVERRGYRDPDDPRNLFAAMYGGNYKRQDSAVPRLTPDQYQYLKTLVHKRGLRDPYDPRNLFHSIYGGIWRKNEDPREMSVKIILEIIY